MSIQAAFYLLLAGAVASDSFKSRAIRRCVVELGKLGNPDMIDQVYLAFKERMSTPSEGNWKPDRDTESDVVEAKRTTSAYRFSSQIPTRQDMNTD